MAKLRVSYRTSEFISLGKFMRKVLFILCLLMLPAPANAGLTFTLNAAAGMDQQAIDGFQRAADIWSGVLSDDVNIVLDIDFRTLSAGVLGSAGSARQVNTISDYFNALNGDATSADDATAMANLPTLDANGNLDFRTQVDTENGSTVVSLDNNDSNNNRFLALNTATAKAVGLRAANNTDADADITFSDAFTWDFDQSDGVDAGHQDFVGVAVHEIGHALGFVSGVDTVNSAINGMNDLESFAVFSGLDMFRYSAADGIVDLSVGTASYTSIDGGTTQLGLMSTGVTAANGGDGRQASHWKDNLGIGIMDPTANPAGQINVLSGTDLRAFDIMGWNLSAVPEPSSLGMLLIAGVGGIGYRRRRKD